MGLSSAYSVAASRISDLFSQIRDGQAPDQLTIQLLKDWGFKSSNDRASIPILKALGFLSPDGKPTSVYHDYRDHSRSKAVMASAIRSAYEDIFLIKEHPTESDKAAIHGKFKSFHNVSDNVASLMTRTFYELLKLSDLKATPSKADKSKSTDSAVKNEEVDVKIEKTSEKFEKRDSKVISSTGLHYNIQIHLPATKDIEVYNSIFKSLKEHLFEE